MKSLKELYNLPYDISGFNSGLITWYNQLIDKSYDCLNVIDVCKMIRQDILKNIAIPKAIDLFIDNPYDGEYTDGSLLNTLVLIDNINIESSKREKLVILLKDLKHTYSEFEWSDEDAKVKYGINIDRMLEKLEIP